MQSMGLSGYAFRLPLGWIVSLVLAVYIANDKAHILHELHSRLPSFSAPVYAKGIEVNTASGFTSSSSDVIESPRSLKATNSSQPSDALLFLIVAILLGTAVTHLTMFSFFHGLQHSVVLFVLGIVYTQVHEFMKDSGGATEENNLSLRSYSMWIQIDPHLILFTMLPALLTGDAMCLDTSVAKRVAKQCIYLASVGVMFCTMATALFCYFYLPYDWSFLLCVTAGAILCATDPVAVVALLKELGASPTLTVQIQGESLLNDGTAIVLYTVARSMILGKKYEPLDITIFLVQKVACACGLGIVIGYVFLYWIRQVGQSVKHSQTTMIQASLTICCAYWSFIFAEGVLHINGVLATVSSALVLAHMMWPSVTDKEALHTIWHVLEYLGNTIIFFLAGTLTGKAARNVEWVDYLHVCVIYVVLAVIRFSMLCLSRPILQLLSAEKQPVSTAEVIVMTWGGLRGAVGLALAIQLSIDRAEGEIEEVEANRLLFYVGGVATLTLVLNATTCPIIVKRLGVTRLEDAKRRMLLLLHRRLIEISSEESNPPAVKQAITIMLDSTLSSIQTHYDSSLQRVMVSLRSGSFISHSVSQIFQNGYVDSIPRSALPLVEEVDCCSATEDDYDHRHESKSTLFVSECLADGHINREISPKLGSQDSRDSLPSNPSPAVLGVEGTSMQPGGPDAAAGPSLVEVRHEPTSPPGTPPPELCTEEGVQREQSMRSLTNAATTCCKQVEHFFKRLKLEGPAMQPASHLMEELEKEKKNYGELTLTELQLLGELPTMPCLSTEKDMIDLVITRRIDPGILRAMTEGFLSLVRSYYLKMIKVGELVVGSPEAEVLMDSVMMALATSCKDLLDFHSILPFIKRKYAALQAPSGRRLSAEANDRPNWNPTTAKTDVEVPSMWQIYLHTMVESWQFTTFMVVAILVNAAFLFVEDQKRNDNNDKDAIWLVADICFTSIFTIEAALKLMDMRCKYFLDPWNFFDFCLVISGIVGLFFEVLALGVSDYSSEGRLVRTARIFRVMRVIRLFRLWRLVRGLIAFVFKHEEELEVQEHIQKITVLLHFARAHIKAQQHLVDYFGTAGVVDTVEVARTILQSQVAVYKAISMAAAQERKAGEKVLMKVKSYRESQAIAEELEALIMEVHKCGIVSNREAKSILDPLRRHVKEQLREIRGSMWNHWRGTTHSDNKSSEGGDAPKICISEFGPVSSVETIEPSHLSSTKSLVSSLPSPIAQHSSQLQLPGATTSSSFSST